MANNSTVTVTLRAVADISDVLANAKQIEKAFDKVSPHIGQDLSSQIKNAFKDIETEIGKIQQKTNKGLIDKKDIKDIEKSYNIVANLLNRVQTLGGKISSSDLSKAFTIDKSEIEGTVNKIKEAYQELQKFTTIGKDGAVGFNGFEKLLEKYQKVFKNSNNKIFKSLDFGSLIKDFKTGDLSKLDSVISKMKSFVDMKKVTKEGTLGRGYQEIVQQLEALKSAAEGGDFTKILKDIAALNGELEGIKSKALEEFVKNFQKVPQMAGNLGNQAKSLGGGIAEASREALQFNENLDRMSHRLKYFFGVENAINLVKRAIRSAYQSVTELDKAMTQTAVVTDFTVGDMWEKLPEYTKMANKLGATTQGAYETSTLYYQQGLNTAQVMAISTETMKMARIAGMEYADATNMMTAALRGFNMAINEQSATRVNDVYSELAAITAADTNQIATAMTKTASIAASANMEFETTAAFLSQIIETTQEAPETAGTALKTIIARFTEVKKLYSQGDLLGTDEEGEAIDVNKIQQALRSVGISMTEFFRGEEGLDDVLLRLAEKWDTLDLTTQRYIATTAAGSRQQSRFLAMMGDYDRTMELVEAANDSAGSSQEQFDKTLDSLESKVNKLNNAWQAFTMSLADDGLVKGAVDSLTALLNAVNGITDAFGEGSGIAKLLLAGGLFKIGTGLTGGMKEYLTALNGGKTGVELTNAFQIGAGKSLGLGTIKLEGGNNLAKELGRSIIRPWQQANWFNRKDSDSFFDKEKERERIIQERLSQDEEYQKARADIEKKWDKKIEKSKEGSFSNRLYRSVKEEKESEAKKEAIGRISTREVDDELSQIEKAKSLDTVISKTQTASIAMMGLAAVTAAAGKALEEAGFSKQAEALNGVASGASTAAAGLQIAGVAAKVFGATAGAALGWISVALGVLIMGFKIIDAVTESSAEKIERLATETQNAKTAANEAKNAYEEFLSGTSQHNGLLKEIEGLVEGTVAFKEAVREANDVANQLISTYGISFDQYSFDENGIITFKEGVLEEIGRKQQATTDLLTRSAQTTEIANKRESINERLYDYRGMGLAGELNKSLVSKLLEGETIEQRIAFLDSLTTDEIQAYVKGSRYGSDETPITEAKKKYLDNIVSLLGWQDSTNYLSIAAGGLEEQNLSYADYFNLMSPTTFGLQGTLLAKEMGYDTSSLAWKVSEEEFYNTIDSSLARTTILAEDGKEYTVTDFANLWKTDEDMIEAAKNWEMAKDFDFSILDTREEIAQAVLQAQREQFAKSELAEWDTYENSEEALATITSAQELRKSTDKNLAGLRKEVEDVYTKWSEALGEETVKAIGNTLKPDDFYKANNLYERIYGFSQDMATYMGQSLAEGAIDYQDIAFLEAFNYEADNQFLVARQIGQWAKAQGTEYSKSLSNLALLEVDAREIFDALNSDESFIELQKELLKEFFATGEISVKSIQEAAEEGSLLADALETGIVNAEGLATSLEMVERGDINVDGLTASLLEANSAAGRLESTIAKAFSYIDSFDAGRSQREFADFTKTGGETITKALSEGRWFDTQLESYYKAIFGEQAWAEYIRTVTEGSGKGLQGRALQEFLVGSSATGDEIRAATSLQQHGDMRGYVQYLYEQAGMQQAFARAGVTVGENGLVTISESTTLDQINQLFDLASTPEGIRDMLIGEWVSMGSGNLYQQWKTQDIEKGLQSFINATEGGDAEPLLAFYKENAEILRTLFPQIASEDDLISYVNSKSNVVYQKSEDFNLDGESWYEKHKEGLSFIAEGSIDIEKASQELKKYGKTGEEAFEIIKKGAIENKKSVSYLQTPFEIDKDMDYEAYQSKLEEISQEKYGNTIGRGIAQSLIEGDIEISPVLDTTQAKTDWATFVGGLTASIPVNLLPGENGSVTLSLGSFSTGKLGSPQNMIPGFSKGKRNYQGPALTGEEGPELVIGRHGAYLTGTSGPEFQYIYKDDAIYTADETKKIFSRSSLPGFEGGTPGNPKVSVIYPSDFVDITSLVSGTGSGSGNKKIGGDWDNPYDELYNLTERINEALREREKLEREYDKLLKDRNASFTDLITNTLDSMAKLRQEIALQQELQAGRARQLQNIGSYTFRDKDKKEKTFAEAGVMQYASYDASTGVITIDWEGIEAVTDEGKGAAIEAYISKLEELVEQFEETEETIADMEKALEEIRDRGKEQYLEFEDRIYEALVEREQKLIDEYEDVSNTINDSNSRILDGLRESIDLSRQIRDNTKTEEEIADKEARLAYLRRDTSGANQLEIQQLEEEIKEMREQYQDTLIDQELDRLSQVNETANEQRERQIEIANAQLETLKENGAFWGKVDELLKEATNSEGGLNNTALADLLKETDGFKGMSTFKSYDWITKLIQEFNEAEAGYSNWMLDKAKGQEYIENTPAGKLTYDKGKDKWTSEDGTEYAVAWNTKTNSWDTQKVASRAPETDIESGKGDGTTGTGGGKTSWKTEWDRNSAGHAKRWIKYVDGKKVAESLEPRQPHTFVNSKCSICGYIKYKPTGSGGYYTLERYATGGLNTQTGPAWLDGTPSRPEYVLNANQTAAFLQLAEVLPALMSNSSVSTSTSSGDNYFNININVDSISSDYDVDRLTERIKQNIYEDGAYRNVNVINRLR